jgi:hypothetical protein
MHWTTGFRETPSFSEPPLQNAEQFMPEKLLGHVRVRGQAGRFAWIT